MRWWLALLKFLLRVKRSYQIDFLIHLEPATLVIVEVAESTSPEDMFKYRDVLFDVLARLRVPDGKFEMVIYSGQISVSVRHLVEN